MQVTAFRVRNFMGFENSDWIELRPLVLLFGRNSSGKSALLRALLLLKQSVNAPAELGPLLWSAADGIDIGNYETVVHCQNPETSLVFGFRCAVGSDYLEYLKLPVKIREPEIVLETEVALESETNRIYPKSILLQISSADEVERRYTILEASIEPTKDGKEWLLGTDLLHEHEYKTTPDIWPHVNIGLGPACFPFLDVQEGGLGDEEDWGHDFNYVAGLLGAVKGAVTSFLESIEYLGPIRLRPQRLYQADRLDARDLSGSGFAALARYARQQDKNIRTSQKDNVGAWLANLGFDAQFDVRHLRRWESSINGWSDTSLFEVKLTEKSGLEIGLPDVGFGISQVLPFIVQGEQSKRGAVLIIEQPELHLHPGAQAELGDLFIQLSKKGIHFLIETHSEHLLLRMRRRLAESSSEKAEESAPNSLASADLMVYFVRREGHKSSTEKVTITRLGEISSPEEFQGFFADDLRELAALAGAKLRNIRGKDRDSVGSDRS